MSNAAKASVTTRNNQCDELITLLNGGNLKIFSGTVPASVDDTPTGVPTGATLIATCPLNATAAPASSGGVITFSTTPNAIEDTNTSAGEASFFRLESSGGTAHVQGTCGTSDAGLIMDDLTLTAAGTVTIDSLTYTLPET